MAFAFKFNELVESLINHESKETNIMKSNWIIGLILAIILAVIAVIFALQNSEPTALSFLAWDLVLPLALIILTSFAIGALVALLLTIPGTFRRKRLISSLNKEKKQLQNELEKLRIKVADSTTEANTTLED